MGIVVNELIVNICFIVKCRSAPIGLEFVGFCTECTDEVDGMLFGGLFGLSIMRIVMSP